MVKVTVTKLAISSSTAILVERLQSATDSPIASFTGCVKSSHTLRRIVRDLLARSWDNARIYELCRDWLITVSHNCDPKDWGIRRTLSTQHGLEACWCILHQDVLPTLLADGERRICPKKLGRFFSQKLPSMKLLANTSLLYGAIKSYITHPS